MDFILDFSDTTWEDIRISGVTKGGREGILPPPKIFADLLLSSNFQRPQPENQKATVESALKIYFLYKDFQNFLKFRGASPPPHPEPPFIYEKVRIYNYPNEMYTAYYLYQSALSQGLFDSPRRYIGNYYL